MEDTLMMLALGVEQARHAHWRGTPGEEMAERDALVQEQFAQERPWGMEASIDLFECDPASIREREKIHAFTLALCEYIHMQRHGEPLLVHFGKEEHVMGYTLLQLIETSNITSHFIEQDNAGCLTLFSCASYPPYAAAAFCQQWFEAREVEVGVTFRGPTQSHHAQGQTPMGEGGETCSHP